MFPLNVSVYFYDTVSSFHHYFPWLPRVLIILILPSGNACGRNVKWAGRRAARFGTPRIIPDWYREPAAPAEASGRRPWSESANLDASGKSVTLEEGVQA